MTDFEDIIAKLKPLPWRLLAILLAISFIVATAASSLVGWLISANLEASKVRPPALTSSSDVAINKPTLGDAEIDKVLKRNIFNSEGSLGEEGESESGADDIPKSDMAVRLLGIIYGGNPYNGMATYENTASGGKVDSVWVGQKIEPDAKLLEIHRRRIIIERGGRKEYIELIDPAVRRSSRLAARSSGTASTPTTSSGVTPVVTRPPPPSYREPGFEREGTKMKISSDFKDRLLVGDEFRKVLQDAKAEPYTQDGALQGFRLTKIREDSIYDKAGLQNDDIIEEINGVPLNDTAGAIRLLNQLRNEKEIEIRVRRGGSPITVNLSVM